MFLSLISKGYSMDRKYLSAPFDMCEYIFGERFVLGGVDFDLDDQNHEEDSHKEPKKPDSLTPSGER